MKGRKDHLGDVVPRGPSARFYWIIPIFFPVLDRIQPEQKLFQLIADFAPI